MNRHCKHKHRRLGRCLNVDRSGRSRPFAVVYDSQLRGYSPGGPMASSWNLKASARYRLQFPVQGIGRPSHDCSVGMIVCRLLR